MSTNPLNDEVQSTNNPRQSLQIYHLAFLIPPLLSAILDTLETADDLDLSENITTLATQFIRTISTSKIDVYNDLLEVVAYRGSKSRRWAIALLGELWPNSVGHTVISSPFPVARHVSDKNPNNLRDLYQHQFVPWYFDQKHFRTNGTLHCDCRSCLKPINGFSLMCPFCMTAVHFDCYDLHHGNYHIQYTASSEQRVQRVALLRFSTILHRGHKMDLDTSKENHILHPANWFTLCLCFICQKPLWGCFAQGLKCKRCPIALHRHCLSSLGQYRCGALEITFKNVSISWDSLRQSCIDHFPVLNSTAQELEQYSYEEISIYRSVLHTQLQMVRNGVTFGSIVLDDNGNTSSYKAVVEINHFELHHVLEQCERLITSGKLLLSPLTQQYMQDNNPIQQQAFIMFNWSFLEYITAAIKTSFPQSRHGPTPTSHFLNVDQSLDDHSTIIEAASLPYESATLVHIRTILKTDFALRSDNAAKFMLDQLHHLSFLDRADGNPFPFDSFSLQSDLKCIFPLPLGLDLSMNVETLVSSIEASLTDLDLTVNEFGFLLLTRRFWPNGLASEYVLRRLSLKVLSWILCEVRRIGI